MSGDHTSIIIIDMAYIISTPNLLSTKLFHDCVTDRLLFTLHPKDLSREKSSGLLR